jgi:hypothetical protein
MTDKPSDVDDKEAERRFQETLGRMVNTPHKPHAPLKPKPAPKSK